MTMKNACKEVLVKNKNLDRLHLTKEQMIEAFLRDPRNQCSTRVRKALIELVQLGKVVYDPMTLGFSESPAAGSERGTSSMGSAE
jgi:hypothetical protein